MTKEEKRIAILERALAREKQSRKDAEQILEIKSMEIYNAYQEVQRLNEELAVKLEAESKQVLDLTAFPRENPAPVMRYSAKGELLYSNSPADVLLDKLNRDDHKIIGKVKEVLKSRIPDQMGFDFGDEYTLLTITPVVGKEYVNIYGFDQTNFKRVEESLRKYQNELDAMLDGGSDLIVSLDPSGKIIYSNEAWKTKMGRAKNHNKIFPYLSVESAGKLVDLIANSAKNSGNSKVNLEVQFELESGTKLNYEVSVNLIFEADIHTSTTLIFRDLTTRRQLELLNQERALLINSSIDAIMSTDENGTVLSWNEAAEKLFGYKSLEIIGESASILGSGGSEMIEEQAEVLAKLNSGKSFSYETERKHKDGSKIFVHVSAFPISDDRKGHFKHGAIIRDITANVVANRELSKSENLLKEAQNIANLASWEWENKTGKFSGPELFLERFNVKTPSAMSRFNELAGIVHPDDRDLVLKKIEQLMASQRSIHVQFRLKVKKSRKIFLEMRANSEFSSSGKLLRIYGVLMDKTSQVESENLKEQFTRELEDQVKERTAMLEISQNELSHQVDTLNQIALVSTIDTEGIITYANDIFCKVSGYSLPELIGKQFADLHSSSQDIASIIGLWGGVEKGDIWKGEVIYQAKDGHDFWLHQTVVPFFNVSGEIEKYVAVSFDVSEEKELQQRLQNSLQKEKELGELKSHFVAMASHQFRTPLAIIQSNSELLSMIIKKDSGESLKEKLSKSSGRITSEISRMTQLMDDVLILGKIGAGHLESDPKELNLAELITEIETHTNSIQQDDRKLDLEIQGNPVTVLLDEKLVQHVIENLVSNAFKYSKDKNPKLTLGFKQKTVSISVEDKGIGIPKNELDKLFQPFHRADNVADIPGTGLGLVIAKEYTELNGGNIQVESKVNEGTKFVVTFPIRLVHEQPQKKVNKMKRESENIAEHNG